MVESEVFENKELDQRADNGTNQEEAILVVNEYETIIRSKKKGILNVAYRQSIIFKQFKEYNKSAERIEEIGVSKSTISCEYIRSIS